MQKGFYFLLGVMIFLLIFLLIINQLIKKSVEKQIYDDIDSLPDREFAVVLGTSKFVNTLQGKLINRYYQNRFNAVLSLYQAHKIKKILLSGARHSDDYDEPMDMKNDLIQKQVDIDAIFLDLAGYRTLDSVIRTQKIFHINHFIFVTQRFHCERALFIAKFYQIDAICFVAEDVTHSFSLVRIREFFAKVWMLFDLLRFKTLN